MANFIGLSLSFCIRDIVEGRMKEDEVKFIIAGTMAHNESDWEEIIKDYVLTYWNNDSLKSERLFWRLWHTGKIIQPRLQGHEGPNIADGHWAIQVRPRF